MASYPFHHSSMESAPVLRRLIVPGHEDRDFISRQTTLPIKTEGIYAIGSTEGKGRWVWKFVYRVSDRMSLMGKAMQGEKVRK